MKLKRKLLFTGFLAAVICLLTTTTLLLEHAAMHRLTAGKLIRWVDFDLTAEAMNDALHLDLETYQSDCHISWIDALAYLGARYGGSFTHYQKRDLDAFAKRLREGEALAEITASLSYFSYYRSAYGAVLDGYVGDFFKDGKHYYGLCAFSPIAAGYGYQHYDDFGAARDYGYRREHLGHDLMGAIGTPIIAVESGYIEAIGWNQYGGWRIGIRSFDNKRYYYYAHLRKDHPYTEEWKEGDIVTAGDVIGYLGMTGYSVKENVNNINTPHLHFGIQLIFDVSQKDGPNQIWIDLYELTKFLSQNRMQTILSEDGKNRKAASNLIIDTIPD